MPARSPSETSESAKRVGSCRGGAGRCRLWRALVRAVARRSHPASLLTRRNAPRLCGHALAVTAPREPAYQLSRPQHRRFGPIAEPWRGSQSHAAALIYPSSFSEGHEPESRKAHAARMLTTLQIWLASLRSRVGPLFL